MIFIFFIHNNIIMMYFVSCISGTINGLFAAAAGQIMIFYLVFVLKIESHKARATSIFCISIITIVSLIGYLKIVDFKIKHVLVVALCGIVFGFLGSRFMNKIKSNYLNLISGLLVFGMGIYNLFFK